MTATGVAAFAGTDVEVYAVPMRFGQLLLSCRDEASI